MVLSSLRLTELLVKNRLIVFTKSLYALHTTCRYIYVLILTILEQYSRERGDAMGKGGGRGGRTANDDRSDSMNPNNPACQDSLDNRSDQLNPNNPEYKGDDEED